MTTIEDMAMDDFANEIHCTLSTFNGEDDFELEQNLLNIGVSDDIIDELISEYFLGIKTL